MSSSHKLNSYTGSSTYLANAMGYYQVYMGIFKIHCHVSTTGYAPRALVAELISS